MTLWVFGIDGDTDTSQDYRLNDATIWVPVSALNVRSGVTSTPTLTGTGSLTANIGAFSAVIDGTSNAQQGCYRITNDTALGITIGTGSAQARIDLVGIQVQDNTWDGSGQHRAIPVVIAGTPGSGSAPAIPANTIPLFNVTVPAGASSVNFATNTVSVFPYTAAAGGIVVVRDGNDKPAVAAGVQYRHRLDVAGTAGTNTPLEWSLDGTTWHPIFDTSAVPASTTAAITAAAGFGAWTTCSVDARFTVGTQPQYRTAPGSRVEIRGFVTTNTMVPTGANIIGTLPAPSANRAMAIADNNVLGFLQLLSTQNTATVVTGGSSIPSGTILGFDGVSYSL